MTCDLCFPFRGHPLQHIQQHWGIAQNRNQAVGQWQAEFFGLGMAADLQAWADGPNIKVGQCSEHTLPGTWLCEEHPPALVHFCRAVSHSSAAFRLPVAPSVASRMPRSTTTITLAAGLVDPITAISAAKSLAAVEGIGAAGVTSPQKDADSTRLIELSFGSCHPEDHQLCSTGRGRISDGTPASSLEMQHLHAGGHRDT